MAATERLADSDRLDGPAAAMRRVGALVEPGRRGAFLRGQWLGHALHPALTDVPLGCWLGANALDLLGGASSRHAAQRLVAIGLLAAPLTALSGLADWSRSADAPALRRVGTAHALGNAVVTAAYLASWQARRVHRHRVAATLGMLGAMMAVGTGHLGGHMALRPTLGGAAHGVPSDPPEAPAA